MVIKMKAKELLNNLRAANKRLAMLGERLQALQDQAEAYSPAKKLNTSAGNQTIAFNNLAESFKERFERLYSKYSEQESIALALEDEVDDLLGRLPSAEQEQELRWKYLDGWTVDKIARFMGVSKRVVYRDLHDALADLEEEISINSPSSEPKKTSDMR